MERKNKRLFLTFFGKLLKTFDNNIRSSEIKKKISVGNSVQ